MPRQAAGNRDDRCPAKVRPIVVFIAAIFRGYSDRMLQGRSGPDTTVARPVISWTPSAAAYAKAEGAGFGLRGRFHPGTVQGAGQSWAIVGSRRASCLFTKRYSVGEFAIAFRIRARLEVGNDGVKTDQPFAAFG